MEKELERKLGDAIEFARLTRAIHGPFTDRQIAEDVAQGERAFVSEISPELTLEGIAARAGRQMRRSLKTTDPRQGWLPFPKFEHVPQFTKRRDGTWIDQQNSSLEEYRESTEELKGRIASYKYSRRSPDKLKRDKQELRERLRLDRTLRPYFAGVDDMTMGRAAELHQEQLETPAAAHNRAIASKGGIAKNRRTRNQ